MMDSAKTAEMCSETFEMTHDTRNGLMERARQHGQTFKAFVEELLALTAKGISEAKAAEEVPDGFRDREEYEAFKIGTDQLERGLGVELSMDEVRMRLGL